MSSTVEEVTELIELRKQVYQNLRYIEALHKQSNNLIYSVDNMIRKKCDHVWVIDTSSYEPCGPTPKICEKCGLDRYH